MASIGGQSGDAGPETRHSGRRTMRTGIQHTVVESSGQRGCEMTLIDTGKFQPIASSKLKQVFGKNVLLSVRQ
jgi:hypothetical protein